MENIFLHLLNMSLTAGVLVVAVVLLRLVFHKAPRWIHCLLWALVAVRLLCPFTFESSLSLMPDTEAALSAVTGQTSGLQDSLTDTPKPDTSVQDTPAPSFPVPDTPVVDSTVGGTVSTPVVTPTPEASLSTPTPEASADPWQIAVAVVTYVWLAGIVLLATYALFTTLRLRRQVGEAAHLEGNLWQCDHIRSPFILGVFRPRVYLPSDLSGIARDSVVAHEQAHLHRRDHWWKPLGFLLLTVYWFNPLMWVAYILLCRDIEAACDERVVRNMNAADRKAYSEALLSCSAPRRLVSACPLAFGETSVKSRIKSVLSYKKPTIWIIVAALLVSTVAGVCLLTDRPADKPDSDDPPAATDKDDDSDSDDPTADDPAVGETVVVEAYNWMGEEELEKLFGYLPESNPALSSDYDALPVKVLYSHAELDAVLLSLQEDRWQKHDFSAFDEDFFEDNHLVMTYYKAGTGTVQPTVGAYVYTEEGACLSVRLDVYQPYAGDTMLGEWLLFSGIQKKDMTGVTQKEAYVWHIIPTDHFIDVFDEPREQPATTMEQWKEREFLSDAQSTTLYAVLHRLTEESGWQSAASVDRAFTFIGCVNVGAADYYVPSDFSALLSEDGMIGWLTAEESALLSEWFPKKNVSDSTSPTPPPTTGTTTTNPPASTTNPTKPTTPTNPTNPTTPPNAPHAVPYVASRTFFSYGMLVEDKLDALYQQYAYDQNSGKDLPIIPITSRTQLNAFIEKYKGGFRGGYGLPSLETLSIYGDDFFANHMLLAVYHPYHSAPAYPQIVAIDHNGNGLVTVQLDIHLPGAMNYAASQNFVLAEVPRAQVANADFRAVIREEKYVAYRWQNYTHPVMAGSGDEFVGSTYGNGWIDGSLWQLVRYITWRKAESTEFKTLGYFSMDDGKRYYVSLDGTTLFDGERIATLNAEQTAMMVQYIVGVAPVKADTYVTGKLVEWNRESRYMTLEVTKGDSALGKRVRVYTHLMSISTPPTVGDIIAVAYDGYYENESAFATIYGLFLVGDGNDYIDDNYNQAH